MYKVRLRGQQKRLLELFQKAYIDEELLEGQIGPLKALTDEKENASRVLEDQQRCNDDATEVERRIVEACREVFKKLHALDFEGKRATFSAFGVKVQATCDEMSITVVVDQKVTTTAQTWECSSNSKYSFVIVELKEVVVQRMPRVVEYVPL